MILFTLKTVGVKFEVASIRWFVYLFTCLLLV